MEDMPRYLEDTPVAQRDMIRQVWFDLDDGDDERGAHRVDLTHEKGEHMEAPRAEEDAMEAAAGGLSCHTATGGGTAEG